MKAIGEEGHLDPASFWNWPTLLHIITERQKVRKRKSKDKKIESTLKIAENNQIRKQNNITNKIGFIVQFMKFINGIPS